MLALETLEADVCPGCNGRLSQTTAEDPWKASSYLYEVQQHRCWSCYELQAEREKHKDDPTAASLLFSTTSTRRPPR